ncbi:MAG: PilZ domain-containing protein [Syntrophaceae bacterium]|nr:PilZ domain-containing protein [Syntrophaceae bacterium]
MRKHKRYALDLPVAVKEAAGQSGNLIFLLRTVDVSAGGALFRAQCGLPAGTDVRLIFFLQTDPLEAMIDPRHTFRGKVVRSGPGQFAVAFVKEMQAVDAAPAAEPGAEAPGLSYGVSRHPDGERG